MINHIMMNWLQSRAQISPHHPAIIQAGDIVTYQQLYTRSMDYAARLPVQPGARVALLMSNSVDYVALIHALMMCGAVIVPINTRLTHAEVQFQVIQTRCTMLIYDDTPPPVDIPCYTVHDLQTLPADNHALLPRPLDMDAPFAIVHTSGTSGKPKGAILTYSNVFYSAIASAFHIGHLPDDVWLCVLPLYHVGGLSILIRACLYGITVNLHPRFDLHAVAQCLQQERVTLVSLVPTMLYRLLDFTPWNPALRLVLLGGAAASSELITQCHALNIPIATTYGLTEAASQVATSSPASTKPNAVGKPLMFTQIRVIDSDGRDQPPGEYGEIIIKSPTVMLAYDNQPQATAQKLRDGWLFTGDIGYFDADGDLFIVQRRSDLIVSGGENVYPAEVEAVLKAHPAVQDAAVVGVDDAEWGQRVAAAIVLRQPLTQAELIAYARQHLAGYKIPRLIHFVEALPQTASGKIHRAAVKQLFLT